MPDSTILLGAVAYDPKVVTIWEGIRGHFQEQGVAMDFALFSNYERQVASLLAGHIDVAWNTPLAHVQVQRRTHGRSCALGMRDSDRDFHAKVVVRKDAGIRSLADLAGKTLAVGSRDSTQARMLPLHFLKEDGVDLARVKILAFDTDVGKHGDTGRSELDVLAALNDGRAHAGTVGDYIWIVEQAAGRVDPAKLEVLWTTPGFDHCMFDAHPNIASEKLDAFKRALFAMQWENPAHRRLMELEGLRKWMPPREEGYDSLRAALDDQGGW
ncbi:MAG: phosphate/phosphite/phosphonate ABC transporter substrate-binding protein [Deltaproteobacteria bacterium]|nr:phosphate/phosphite/phosphonate ABC transporter substrate-binding protein [Deltaproteobacteria bacterium]MBI3386640.1 phosphate/phosphite/phosphonate ABC transporter substrate-binding protein [Deltaproteobacteria bacterium]